MHRALEIIKRNVAARSLLAGVEGDQTEDATLVLDLEELDTKTLLALQAFVRKTVKECEARDRDSARQAGGRRARSKAGRRREWERGWERCGMKKVMAGVV